MNIAEELKEILTDLPQTDVDRLIECFENEATMLLKKARCEEKMANRIVGIAIPYSHSSFDMKEILCTENISEYEKKNDLYRRIIRYIPGKDLIIPRYYSSELREFMEWAGGSVEGYPMDRNSIAYRFAEELEKNGFNVEFVFKRRNKYADWTFSGLIAYFR